MGVSLPRRRAVGATKGVRHLLAQTGGKCFYCGNPLADALRDWIIPDPEARLVREHKVPLSREGEDGPDNCVPSCSRCNRLKYSFTADEYRFLCGLRRGDLGFVFPFEIPEQIQRDWLCVHSEPFERSLLCASIEGAAAGYRKPRTKRNWGSRRK